MIDFAAILEKNPNGVLATQDGAKVRTRIFKVQFVDGNKVYFGTSSEKPVYGQLLANPSASFCTFTGDFSPVLSISGKVIPVEDRAVKTRIFNQGQNIQEIYKTPDNPVFKIFYLDVEEAETFSFTEGARRYTL
jgi:uncharacterized pyridoxamine 5'-phosphate oxidase family protein